MERRLLLAAAIAQTWLACADDVVGVTLVAVSSNDVAAAVETGVREVELRDRMAATTLISIQSHIRQILAK